MQKLSGALLGWISRFALDARSLVNFERACKSFYKIQQIMDPSWQVLYLRDWEAASVDDAYIQTAKRWKDRYAKRHAIEQQWNKPNLKLETIISLRDETDWLCNWNAKRTIIRTAMTKLLVLKLHNDNKGARLSMCSIPDGKFLDHVDIADVSPHVTMASDEEFVAVCCGKYDPIVHVFRFATADNKLTDNKLTDNKFVKQTRVEIDLVGGLQQQDAVDAPMVEIHDSYLLFLYSSSDQNFTADLWDWRLGLPIRACIIPRWSAPSIAARPCWRSMKLYVYIGGHFQIHDLLTGGT